MGELDLYIDSSVWNFSFNEHVPDLRAQTRSFFDRIKADRMVEAFLSDVVLQELGNAPEPRRGLVAELIREMAPSRLDLDEESTALADGYVRYGVLTERHSTDARHVAIATARRWTPW